MSKRDKNKAKSEPIVTGWDNGLNQDYNKKLARWFSEKPNARQEIRDLFGIQSMYQRQSVSND